MPDIEQYGGPQVRARPKDAPLINPGIATPDAFGAAVADGLQRGGLGVAEAMKKAESDRDLIEAMNANNAFLEEDHQKMSEYRSRTGGNAKDLTTEAAEDYKKRQAEHEGKLTSPGAKERFRKITDARWVRRNSPQLIDHQREQMRKYESDTLTSSINNVHKDALDDGTDEALAEADRMSELTIHKLANMQGTDPQTREAALRGNRQSLYGSAIEQDIDAGNWKGASERLTKFGGVLDPMKRGDLERRTKEGGLNQQAQDTADTIFKSGYATKKADADKMVGAIKDEDLRSRTQAKVDHEWARREAALAEARGATFEGIAAEVEAGGDVEALLAKHPDAPALEQVDRARLRNLAGDVAKGHQPVPLGDTFLSVQAMATTPELRNQFLRTPLGIYRGSMTKEELAGLVKLQGDLRSSPDTGGGDKLATIASMDNVREQTLRSIGIDPSLSEKNKDSKRALGFQRELQRQVWNQQQTTGKKLDDQGMQAIADRLVMDTIIHRDRSPFSPMRFAPLIGSDTYDVHMPAFEALNSVPEADKQQIREAYKEQGKEPTDVEIIRAYEHKRAKAQPAGDSSAMLRGF